MGKVYRLEEARRRQQRSKERVSFTRQELNSLLSLYSRNVMSGEWRDYAIDLSAGMAIFSIFRHSHERPLFSVVKRNLGGARAVEFTVSCGVNRMARAESLADVLKVFEKRLKVVRAGPY